jgi:hypothetical protein
MEQRPLALVALFTAIASPACAVAQGSSAVHTMTMKYFESHRSSRIDELLTQTHPEPVGRSARDAVIVWRPRKGELQPKAEELAKIDAVRAVVQYHQDAAGTAYDGAIRRALRLLPRQPDEIAVVERDAARVTANSGSLDTSLSCKSGSCRSPQPKLP